MAIFEPDEIEQLILDLQANHPSQYNNKSLPKPITPAQLGIQGKRLFRWIIKTSIYCTHYADLKYPESSLRSFPVEKMALRRSRFRYLADIAYHRESYKHEALFSQYRYAIDLWQKGRFLTYYPDVNLQDGAAYGATNGFFGQNNIPPWDTWIDYFEEPITDPNSRRYGSTDNYLIAWIPDLFVPLAQKGIYVNPEACIEWTDQSNLLFNPIWQSIVSLQDN